MRPRRIRVRPTALGWKALAFHALLLTAFYVSPYTNLFFLMLSFFTVLLALTALWTRANLTRVTARVGVPSTIEADRDGAPASIEIVGGRGTALTIAIQVAKRRRSIPIAECDLEPDGRPIPVTGRLPALARGEHPLRGGVIRSSAPSGIWSAQVECEVPLRILAHAAPLDETLSPELRSRGDGDANGGHAVAASDSGAIGLRDWRSGDALRSVDWRATARRRRPIAREYEVGLGDSLVVSLDRRLQPAALERALSELVTLGLRARRAARRMEVRSQDLSATFGDGARPFDELLRWTALAGPTDAPMPPIPSAAIRLPLRGGPG